MTGVLIIHFGSPRNRAEVGPFLADLFADSRMSPINNKTLYALIARPIAMLAGRIAMKKYASVGFVHAERLAEFEKRLKSRAKADVNIFMAARYGQPSIEQVLEQIEGSNINRVAVIPLYPHASPEMYDSMVEECLRLKKLYFRNLYFSWSAPFYDNPYFIGAWADSINSSLKESPNFEDVHLLFSAHSIPERCGADVYRRQVEISVKKIIEISRLNNTFNIAYQSAGKLGKWMGPSVKNEMGRLSRGGVLNCLIVPISFLFDNTETLIDIDKVIIPSALKAGMSRIKCVHPPGGTEKIAEMFVDIIGQ